MRQLEKDKEFLQQCNLMDYSLLLYFFKKPDVTDDESAYSQRQMQPSILVKSGIDGKKVIELQMHEVN